MHDTLQKDLSALLSDTHRAHTQAFSRTAGADPDWPLWYADHMLEAARKMLGTEIHASQLVYCLMNAEIEHRAMAPGDPWPEFYAAHLIECHAQPEEPAAEQLALYHYEGCPFCAIARAPMDRLGLDVEMRDILQNRFFREELIAARGRATVPVLRITNAQGEDRWMPESRDIAHYIESTYG